MAKRKCSGPSRKGRARQAPDFVRLINEYTEEIRQLGPFTPERETVDATEAVAAQTAS